ncbi:hypothetical protein FRC02_006887 [Tulasnella sp. 418]|nr:hypothetical protein FRC02_006887 [Tulasnella sp. 418]
MALILATVCLRRANISFSDRTNRDVLRYHSWIDSITGPDTLAVNIFTDTSRDILPPGTWVTIRGTINEGSKGATADIEVDEGGLIVVDPPLTKPRYAQFYISGRVHKTYFREQSCLIIETWNFERQWFYALPMHHFSPRVRELITLGDYVIVEGSYGGLYHSTDDCGVHIEIVPNELSVSLKGRIMHFLSTSIIDDSDGKDGLESALHCNYRDLEVSSDGDGDTENWARSDDPDSDEILRAAAAVRRFDERILGREGCRDQDLEEPERDIVKSCHERREGSSLQGASYSRQIAPVETHSTTCTTRPPSKVKKPTRQAYNDDRAQQDPLAIHSSPISSRTRKRRSSDSTPSKGCSKKSRVDE